MRGNKEQHMHAYTCVNIKVYACVCMYALDYVMLRCDKL